MTKTEIRMRRIKNNRKRQIRRRVLLAILGVFLVLIGSVVLFSTEAHAETKDSVHVYKYYRSITVNANDTLWSFAEEYAPNGNYREYIDELMIVNNLDSDLITAGMNLIVPYYSTEFVS